MHYILISFFERNVTDDNTTPRLSCRANEQTARAGAVLRSLSNPAPRQTSRSVEHENTDRKSVLRNILQNASPRMTSYNSDNNIKNIPNHNFQMHGDHDEETDISDDISTIIDDSSTKCDTSRSNFTFPSSSSVKINKSNKSNKNNMSSSNASFLNSSSVKLPRNVPHEECSSMIVVSDDSPKKRTSISHKHRNLLLMTERAKNVDNAYDSGRYNGNSDNDNDTCNKI